MTTENQPQYGPPQYAYTPQPKTTSGLAVASLVLGILWLGWLGSLLAVIFGHISLGRMKQDPSVSGRGLAIAGLVLGYIGIGTLIVWMLLLIGLFGASSTA
ncbi:DUF4190 domain-containing protein [Jiangella rhizosphaerae]|uniref:DUF4190 domain-containing protein n=1 Tax=Jiangella rhizosphaerae TaxID=2293569 RepID=A0A418KH16_9ACTN|nr:DUF4190 domain-containing protein [Jiangella rhizosphaerae]RIQ11363.1 DUF4190 domain-containing protein [Jiangella rhizosphaerae]